MSDKKSDDYYPGRDNGEKERFIPAAPAFAAREAPAVVSDSLNKINQSPGLSVLAYCLSSISMTVVNKYVVSGSKFNMPLMYLGIQNGVGVAAILACKQLGLITTLAPFDTEKAKKWLPISFLLLGMIFTGTKALQFLSVPVYTIFKNLTIIVIAYGEVLWFGGQVTSLILLSFGMMVLSSIIAAWSDVQSAATASADAMSTLNAGYAWMFLNVLCSSTFVLGMRKVIRKMNFSDWDTMFYNNFLTIPIIIILTFLIEDWSSENLARNFPVETRNNLLLGMVYSGLCAIFISYCSAWCIRVTSSTTYSMVGALNKLPIAVSGLVFFDAPVTFGSVSAIFLGFVSGIVYTWGKVQLKEQSKMSLPTTNRPVMSASAKSNNDAANS
ncbi:hypothetical protein NHJ13051_006557 [Beauveria bassiana]|uniref:GDP-mannose transporter n=1 Tax=Beauveria bassiana TaxID=176275 RepID=A0A2N6NU07_BEABA|nr:GDP-mannose transporter [Beauveria bassiana]